MDQQVFNEQLQETFEYILKDKPVYSQLIERFQPLLHAQARLAQAFGETDFGLGPIDPERAGHGVSYLTQTGLPECGEQLATAMRELLPVLEESFGLKQEMEPIAEAVAKDADDGGLDLAALAKSYLEGTPELIRSEAERIDASEAVLGFAVRSMLTPVLSALACHVQKALKNISWTHGHCPVCGQAPSVATLSKFINTRDESLVGGGGKKRLTCSLCAHQWDFRRGVCPACDNDDADQRELIFAENTRHERIEACKKCGTYLLCVDLRELANDPTAQALPLGLVHLDIIARKKNYAPLAQLPWNTQA